MIWEISVVCFTIYVLFGGYIKEKVRAMEIENDKREDENLHRRNDS